MRLFRRTPLFRRTLLFRETLGAGRAGRKASRAERLAAERTARAEATLVRTEQEIHDLADEVRRDLKGTSRKG
jgi:hypothetical protein